MSAYSTTQEEEEDSSTPTPLFQILTWYLADPLSWVPLATLLSSNPRYAQLEKLELVDPTEEVPDHAVQTVISYIQTNHTLKELVVFTTTRQQQDTTTTTSSSSSSNDNNTDTASLIKRLEQAVQQNTHNSVDCRIEFIQLGSRKALCDSLSLNEYRKRQLMLDGNLLQGMTQYGWVDLAKHFGWDKSIRYLLVKDLESQWLNLLLQKVSHGNNNNTVLETLKIVYDPGQSPVDISLVTSAGLTALVQAPNNVPLQRLYFVNCQFRPTTDNQRFVTALKSNTTLRSLDLVLCQFESGTGRQWQTLVEGNKSLQQITFQYPKFNSSGKGAGAGGNGESDSDSDSDNSDGNSMDSGIMVDTDMK